MSELGRYDLSNSNLIDLDNLPEDIVSISVHEDVHRVLCGGSSYGLLTLMMEKNKLFESSHGWLLDLLLEHMLNMQETLAIAIEYLTIHKDYGDEVFRKRLQELQENSKYHNYFRKLLFSNLGLDNYDTNLLRNIGIFSLNIDLHAIPFQDFTNKKDFQRFINQDSNNLKYLPNSRFKTLFNLLFRKFDQNEMNENLDCLLEGTVKMEDYPHEDTIAVAKYAREAIRRIYSNSEILDRIMKRVATIGGLTYQKQLYEGVSLEFLTSYPMDLNNRLGEKYKVQALKTDKFWKKFSEFNKDNLVMKFEHLLGGFEEGGIVSLWDLENSAIYSTFYPIESFDNVVSEANCPIVLTKSKLFRRVKYKIRGLSNNLPIYLLMDGSIGSEIEFILKHFKNGKYTYFQNENHTTLIIFRGSYVLVQFIVFNLVDELDSLLNKTANIEFVEYQKAPIDKKLLHMISKEGMKLSSYALRECDKKK